MKILFLITQDLLSPYGIGRCFPLAKELSTLGHNVKIIGLHSDFGSLSETRTTVSGVEIRYVAPMHVMKKGNKKIYYPAYQLIWLSLKAVWQLGSSALHEEYDILHVGKPHPMNSLPISITRYFKTGQIYLDCDDYETTSATFSSEWQRKVVNYFETHAPKWADFVTTNTSFTKNRIESYGINPNKIFYLPNGVDLARFTTPDPAILLKLSSDYHLEGKKVISFIGTLSRSNHPVNLLLEAFSLVISRIPDSVLLIVGGGDDFDYFQQEAQKLGIADYVRFCGRVAPECVSHYYYLSDVTIDPVWDDDTARGRAPLKLFESWACGVPFISGNVGDRKLLLGSPAAGLLTEPGNPDALANAILQVIENPQNSREMVELGYERVRSYTWKEISRKMESIYLNNRNLNRHKE